MKSSLMISVVGLTAAAAFGLGWSMKPAGSSNVDSKAGAEGKRQAGSGDRTAGGRAGSSSSYRGGKSAGGPVEEFVAKYAEGGAISGEDMKAAIEEMRKENDPLLRRKMFQALLDNLTAENAKDAFLALQSGRRGGFGRGGGGEDELRLLANAWGRLDGPGAIQALTEIREAREAERGEGEGQGRDRGRGGPGGDRGGMEMLSVLSGWATEDPSSAAKYVEGMEDERMQRMYSFGIVQGMLVNGVDEAMGYINGLPAGEDGDRARGFYMAAVTGEVLEQGIDAAKSWVDTISDSSLRSGAMSRVAETMVRQDLEGAVEWISQYANDESASRAVTRVASEWAEKDPQAVLEWAGDLPDATQVQVYEEALNEWTQRDAVAAGEYLSTLAASPTRDAAVEGFATELARKEPANAMAWAETIASPESRAETVTQVARSWMRTDRTAATEWLETSGLPAETQEAITTGGGEGFRGGFQGRGPGGGGPGGRGRGRGR